MWSVCQTKAISRRGQRGSSLTEFAIVAPLFITLIYGSLYLTDVGNFKLKAQEIARFGTWSFTQHPLSNYEDGNFRHDDSFTDARNAISDDLYDVYYDLDGANDRFLPVPGAWSKTMSAQYVPPTAADLRNRPVQLLPSWAQIQWTSPLSSLGMALSILGFGTGTESLVSGPFQRLRLNRMGKITGRSRVIILPPIRPDEARQSIAMARHGGVRGADLRDWLPAGQTLRDTGGGQISNTLVADSWKVHDGASAHPLNRRGYANIVTEVSDNGITALPGGQILAFITGLNAQLRKLPP
ncbi:MAG: TadE family protein, partial [Myxococcota bacterium]